MYTYINCLRVLYVCWYFLCYYMKYIFTTWSAKAKLNDIMLCCNLFITQNRHTNFQIGMAGWNWWYGVPQMISMVVVCEPPCDEDDLKCIVKLKRVSRQNRFHLNYFVMTIEHVSVIYSIFRIDYCNNWKCECNVIDFCYR